MPTWECLYISEFMEYLRVAPSGKINYSTLLMQPKKISYYDYWDADDLYYGNDLVNKAKHMLMDKLSKEGWEPFAVERGTIYFKRIQP